MDSNAFSSFTLPEGTDAVETSTSVGNESKSSTTSTTQLDNSAADSVLKNLGINLKDLGISGASTGGTFTLTRKISSVGRNVTTSNTSGNESSSSESQASSNTFMVGNRRITIVGAQQGQTVHEEVEEKDGKIIRKITINKS